MTTKRSLSRCALAATMGLAVSALAAPAALAQDGPKAFQGNGINACQKGTYCFYKYTHFNNYTTNAQDKDKWIWQYDQQWPNFTKNPDTGESYTPYATNNVKSIVNDTNRRIYFMEWDFDNVDADGFRCIGVRAHTAVDDVVAQNSDGGYGSVSFNNKLANKYNCDILDPTYSLKP